jgi:hypothetical protein
MDAITRFHVRLDCHINSPRNFKCFNLQFVLPLLTSTSEEFFFIIVNCNNEPAIVTINLLLVLRSTEKSTTKKVVYFEETIIFNTQLISAHRGTVLLLPEGGVHNHRNARARISMCKKKQFSVRQLVNKRIVINSVPFTVQHFQPILPSRNYKFSHKRTNIQLLPSACN